MENGGYEAIKIENSDHALSIFGFLDKNVEIIGDAFSIDIMLRDDEIQLTGPIEMVDKGAGVLRKLVSMAEKGENITRQNVAYLVDLANENHLESAESFMADVICVTPKGMQIKPKTSGQKIYTDSIRKNTVTFGIGPAGTGKTFIAVALAVTAFRNKEFDRIIITRPAVEAGEKLGFLPGDLQEKVDPYLRPLYDAMYELMGTENYLKYFEKGMIEVAPLAYMRGRTLDNSFIILDEAQNTTPEQMKMFLTRIGFNSKVVVTGDITQIDLPPDKLCGAKEAAKILKDIPDIGFVYLTEKDVVRHELVQRIIKAYEKYENRT